MRVPCTSKVHSNWFLSIYLALLSYTSKVLTEPGFGWPGCTSNVLRTYQLSKHSWLLGTAHTVDHTSSVTEYGPLDGEGVPSEVASVSGGVAGVRTHTAVCPLPTLLETLSGLSSSLSVLRRGNFRSLF